MLKSLQKPLSKDQLSPKRKSLSVAEAKFVKAYGKLGDYAKASREAYPNVKDANDYGYQVAQRPHIKPLINEIKQRVVDSIDDAFIYNRFNEIYENTVFKKIILKKRKIAEDAVYEEETEVDQTPLALNALKGIAQFKRSALQSLGNVNIQLNINPSLLGSDKQRIIEGQVLKQE